MRLKVLHIIDALTTGGAEVLLLDIIDSLVDFENILVILENKNEFQERTEHLNVVCLNYRSKLDLFHSVRKLKNIIRLEEIDIVHAHLLSATFIARLAIDRQQRLIFSVHNILSKSAFKVSKMSWLLEKIFYKRWHEAIFVSNQVKLDYEKQIGIRGSSHILYNFIGNNFFQKRKLDAAEYAELNCVSVGKLKEQKNFEYLIDVFSRLGDIPLDIFGDGPLWGRLEQRLSNVRNDNVKLCGRSSDVASTLSRYNIFILASHYEGFGIALVEAMASNLLCIVSDIPTFREVGKDTCIYFDPQEPDSLFQILDEIRSNPLSFFSLIEKSKKRASLFTKKSYIQNLIAIYHNQNI
ncbi:MAG: glycosyltransferase [Bacteroidota bacterium]